MSGRPYMTAWVVVEWSKDDRRQFSLIKDGLRYEGPTVKSAIRSARERALDWARFASGTSDYKARIAAVGVDRSHWGGSDEEFC